MAKKKTDIVTITCYNSERKMERQKAMEEFSDAILFCEGSERDRYCSIVAGLKAGKSVVDDEWQWCN